MSRTFAASSAAFALLAFATAAAAQDAPAALAPTTDDPPLCTDRPTKGNVPCTVPAGKWQVESDLFNATFIRSGGVSTDIYLFTNPTLKFGLSDRADIQVNWAPYVEVHSKIDGTGIKSTDSGVGDVFVRLKYNIPTGSDKVALAVLPFVKAPTAPHGIGNGEWEGGVAVPVSVALPNKFTLLFGPEVDVLADSDGDGRHAQLVNLVNVSRPVTDKLTVAGELWSAINFDPVDTIEQYSADVAAAYALPNHAQVDLGANFGLNDATPDVQVYVGVSKRF